MSDWTRRIRRPPGPEPLQELRDAGEDLARQARHAPGRTGIVFQNVANVAIIGTVLISGALAAVHLWRALFPRHHEPRQGTPAEPAGGSHIPSRRRQPYMALADGNERDHLGRREFAHQGDDRGRFPSR
jgi:hypothetical protein